MLIVIFSIIGTSIMALCYRKVFSAARNKTSMTEKTALYQASEFVLDSVRSAVETVANSSDGSADPFSFSRFTIHVNYENTDGSGENSDNEAVTIDKYSCIPKDGETNTYTVSFTATYGTTSLKVTAEIKAVSSSEGSSDLTANLTAKVSITQWEWEYHATIEEESAGAEEET